MANPAKPESVGHFIEKRLSDLSAKDTGFIRNLASAILGAADRLSMASPDDEFDPDSIPTNGDLFGDEWEGKRLFWFGEWKIPGTDEWHKFSGTLPDLTSTAEIYTHAAELATSYIDAYPGKFLGGLAVDPGEVTVKILGVEKAF